MNTDALDRKEAVREVLEVAARILIESGVEPTVDNCRNFFRALERDEEAAGCYVDLITSLLRVKDIKDAYGDLPSTPTIN